jgi:EAL domain-containing protein (putative c-di-GMP-specific phosphodiesterase class I)
MQDDPDYARTPNPLGNFLTAAPESAAGGRSHIDAILDAVRRHLGMEIAFTSRYDGDVREFTHISAAIPVPSAPGDREPADQSYCHHVLHGRLPELICNAADLSFASTLPITAALPVGAHISVPLRFRDGRVYGSFCCLSRNADYSLTDRDLATVRAFAALAGEQIELEQKEDAGRRLLSDRIAHAMAARQPVIHLQPIHRLDSGRTAGAEALARFPDRKERAPNHWFEEAFDVGLGVDLELAAVRQALAALPFVPAGQYLSINVSPATLLSDGLTPLIEGIGTRDVVLEITEHKKVDDHAALRRRLARLRRYVRVAIDDVGAGYAGLQHIIAFEPDILKLDLSLTRGIDGDAAKRALAVAMVSFAAGIGSAIVAEGVERQEERDVLRDLGIVYGQGWLFSRAMPVVAAQQCMLGMVDEGPSDVETQPMKPAIRGHKRATR